MLPTIRQESDRTIKLLLICGVCCIQVLTSILNDSASLVNNPHLTVYYMQFDYTFRINQKNP